MKLKYGVLSTASIVPRFINALKETGTGEVVAIASRTMDRARNKAKEWGIQKYYDSYEKLLLDEDIDVVYVAMINSEHYKNALLALQHKKHVVCEKPLALRKKEVEHLFAYAKEQNRFICEAQKVVFLPTMQKVKAIISSGELGEIHLVDLTSSCEATYNTWLHSKECGGGALYGNASYGIHLVRYLFECNISAYSGICTKGRSAVDEQCALNLQLENDVLVVSKISTNVHAINKAFIYGTKGYVEIKDYWKARSATIHYKDKEAEEIHFPCEHELRYELSHFNQCICEHELQSPIMNKDMSISSIEIIETLRERW